MTTLVRGIGMACVLLAGCSSGGGGGNSTPTTPTVPTLVLTTIAVSVSPATIQAGQTTTASAAGLDQNGGAISTGAVTWSSSAQAVATVTSAGVVSGLSPGQAVISAAAGGKQGQAALTVTTAPVATVNVTPASASLAVNATQQLAAATLDAAGNTLSGRVVAWGTSDATRATVSATGLVTAVAAGSATITALSEGKSGTSAITVIGAPVPVATVTVSPANATVVAGATQQLSATTRDAAGNVLAGRVVTWTTSDLTKATVSVTGLVSGVAAGTATITATSETKTATAAITVTASQAGCASGTALQLNLGDVRTLTAAQVASLCLGGSASAAEYVLIPFGNSTVASSTVQVQIDGTNTSAILVPPLAALQTGAGARLGAQGVMPDPSMEMAFRQRERRELSGLRVPGRGVLSGPLHLTTIPATPAVGSIVQLNANLNASACAAKQLIPARVAAVLPHAIVFIDTLAPAGGYTEPDLAAFGTSFDTLGFALDTLNFGTPSDIDGNGRVGIFFTANVNRIPGPPGGFIGGLFFGRDLFPATGSGACAGSNEGEMFYMPVPDPASTINGNYKSKTTLSNVVLPTLVHEFQHLINASRRIYINNAPITAEELWLNEGLSHIAEELLYYKNSGNSPRLNIDLTLLRSSQAQIDAFNNNVSQNFGRLGSYLAAPSINSPFAQMDGLEMRGAIWQLLRYSADRKGGSDRSTWFALVNSLTAGQANFNAVFGDIITNARDWAVAQFTNDAGLGVAANYTDPSWNFRNIYPAITNAKNFPIATQSLIGGGQVSLTINGGAAAYVRFRVAANVLATVASTSSGQPVPATVDFILVRTQ